MRATSQRASGFTRRCSRRSGSRAALRERLGGVPVQRRRPATADGKLPPLLPHALTRAGRRVHQAGVDAGFRTNGEPGYRAYGPGYYAAFLLDPDGNNVEALYRDEGNIGHGIGPHLR